MYIIYILCERCSVYPFKQQTPALLLDNAHPYFEKGAGDVHVGTLRISLSNIIGTHKRIKPHKAYLMRKVTKVT